MALTPIQRVSQKANSTVSLATMTFASTVTANSTLVAVVCSATPLSSFADSRGNTWTKDVEIRATVGTNAISVWRAKNVFAGTTQLRATQSGTGTRPIMWECSEVGEVLSLDAFKTASGVSNAPATGSPSAQNLAAESYNVAAFHAGSGISVTVTSRPPNWNLIVNNAAAAGTKGEVLDRVHTWATELPSATWAITVPLNWLAAIATYVVAPTAVADPSPYYPRYFPFIGGLPMIPGMPWFPALFTRYGDPAPQDPAENPPELPLIPPIPDPDDGARLQEALRKIANVLNSLARIQQMYLAAPDQPVIRGRGLSGTSAPGVSNDSTTGAGYGTVYVDRSDPSNPAIYVCTSPAAGAATWLRLKTVGIGGVTGSF